MEVALKYSLFLREIPIRPDFICKSLRAYLQYQTIFSTEKAKTSVRRGRKAADLLIWRWPGWRWET
jgi:hypothetical protein